MLAGSIGGSVEMWNKRRRDNVVEADGIFEKFKETIFIVIILAIGKNICPRELFMLSCKYISFLVDWLIVSQQFCFIINHWGDVLFYLKRITYLCGFWRFVNALITNMRKEKSMYEFECLTKNEKVEVTYNNECSPFLGGCYPEAEGCCGPECSPN